ncbi:transposase [Geodermatophilus bullaregiensis]|uniref:IS110 family transposase n=1 Tax=Geodermatophilus bullaregiensis TaxID=1564160 RepID=UPI0019599C01|nr:transposase [Geodermatophilus bullaregiensis]MBM7808492.1 transposase [Geodermatophilus bullaregiensis]
MLAGIDTHKDTLAVAVIDDVGRPVAITDLPNTEAGFDALEQLLTDRQVTRVGIEGSGNYGRGAAVRLVLAGGIEVVEVPPSLTSRERSAKPGQGKTDPIDAVAIARITAREAGLPPVRLAVGQAADLRALADYRTQLVAECTALASRTHAELHGLREQIAELVQRSGSSLTGIYGIGVSVAARILAEVVDVRRYRSRHAFAAANGSAPIPASSGRTMRHRLNRGGNRQLNRALYTIAITEIRADTEGRAYYARKRAEGKTGREALRCLKRRLSDVVYRTLRADQAADPLQLLAATA